MTADHRMSVNLALFLYFRIYLVADLQRLSKHYYGSFSFSFLGLRICILQVYFAMDIRRLIRPSANLTKKEQCGSLIRYNLYTK